MTATIDSSPFLSAFEALDRHSPVQPLRQSAVERFNELGLPTTRDEEWRYTNIRPIRNTSFVRPDEAAVSADQLRPHVFTETDCHRLVFVNGRYEAVLSDVGALDAGVRIEALADVLADDFGAIEPVLGSLDRYRDDAFAALNTAFLEDGALIHLPRGAVLGRPVHLLFVTVPGAEPSVTYPRILILAEAHSQATIVEEYVGLDDGVYFTNVVTEILAGEGTHIDHYKIEREAEAAFHISTMHVRHERSSNFTSHCYSIGGRLVRHNVDAALDGEDIDATFNGLYLTQGQQHVDNHLRIDHLKPHCRSWQFYKGILNDQSSGVFSGRILVKQDAQKTDAKQTNMNLLLSPDAHVETKPRLEIFADDVKCTHGATIGQLDETMMFYLQARGIGREAARSLLIYAFANETISEVRLDELRRRLERVLLERLPQGHALQGA